jgi:thiamine biosynthesis lipoprotein
MGTVARVRVWGPDSVTCARAVNRGFEALHRADSLMSTYRPDSDVSRLNGQQPNRWVSVDPHTYRVIDRAVRIAADTDGAFDPTVLPLMRLWGFRGGLPRMPTAFAVDSALVHVDYRKIEFDADDVRLRLGEGTAVDLGGIAKGYALELGEEGILSAGASAGTVDLGGNLIVFGPEANGPVAIQDPTRSDGTLGTIELEDASVATSGGYERYVTIDGRRYGHILDPRNGRPVAGVASVTVVGRDAALVDAVATAAYVMGVDDGLAFIASTEGIEGCVVWVDNGELRIEMTAGFREGFTRGGIELR